MEGNDALMSMYASSIGVL